MKKILFLTFAGLMLCRSGSAQVTPATLVSDELKNMGLAAQLVYLKHASETKVMAQIIALHPELLHTTTPAAAPAAGGAGGGGAAAAMHFYLNSSDYNDPVIAGYINLRIKADQFYAEMVSDMIRGRFRFYRKLDNLLVSQSDASKLASTGTAKMDAYRNNLAAIYKDFQAFIATVPPVAVPQINHANLAAAVGGDAIADYTGIFTAAYGVEKDISTTNQSKHAQINTLLNALRLPPPEDLLHGVSEVPWLQSGAGAGGAGGGGGAAGASGAGAGGGG